MSAIGRHVSVKSRAVIRGIKKAGTELGWLLDQYRGCALQRTPVYAFFHSAGAWWWWCSKAVSNVRAIPSKITNERPAALVIQLEYVNLCIS
jgi:hypothetical protein